MNQVFHDSRSMIHERGFTLLELLLVVSIVTVLAALGFGYFRNAVKNIQFDTVAKSLAFDLKNARTKAMSGESDVKWGIHFVNGTDDYYELFSTPTIWSDPGKTVFDATYLAADLAFGSPSEGNTTDIIFNKIAGTTSANSVTITFEGNTKTITVTAEGTIY